MGSIPPDTIAPLPDSHQPVYSLPWWLADALKVYVGNIPPDTSVDEIRDTFKGFGRVRAQRFLMAHMRRCGSEQQAHDACGIALRSCCRQMAAH